LEIFYIYNHREYIEKAIKLITKAKYKDMTKKKIDLKKQEEENWSNTIETKRLEKKIFKMIILNFLLYHNLMPLENFKRSFFYTNEF
jgi:hypothetical protein